jgi:hypothetical protein
MFEIDPIIYRLKDERTIALRRGAISKEIFLGLVHWQKDPFTLQNGRLSFMTTEMQETYRRQFIDHHLKILKESGGLTGTLIYDNFNSFVKVYPELLPMYEKIKSEIEKEQCQGCVKNTKTQPLYDEVVKMSIEGRDIDSLGEVFKKYPYVVKKLKREPFEVKAEDILIPPELTRREIPFMTDEELNAMDDIVAEVPLSMTRESCLDCVRGHLFEAQLLFKEVLKGYSPEKGFEHKGQALAHLGQAEAESLKEFPELSLKIRILKLKMSGQRKYVEETT